MIDDKDVKKLIDAMKGIFVTKKDLSRFATKKDLSSFPNAKMMNDSFETVATKVQVQKLDKRITGIEEKLERLDGMPARVKKLEEALAIDD